LIASEMDKPLEQLVEACAAYHRDMALAHIDTLPGEARSSRVAEAVRRGAEICSVSALQSLQTHVTEAPAASQSILRQLQSWARTMYLRGAMLPHQLALQTQQRSAVCTVDDEAIPLLSSFAAMAMETRRDRRASIEAAVSEQLDDMSALFDAQFKALCQAAEEIGYTSLEHLWADLLPSDLAAQQEDALCLLKATEDVYTDLLTWAVRQRLRIPPGQLHRHDILALFTLPDYQKYYQPGAMIDGLQTCLREMAIDPNADGRITLRQRSAATGFPEAAAVQIPDEVVLSYGQVAGLKASEAYASAFGRALLWAYTSPQLPSLIRQLGDAALPISSAQLFAEMVALPGWLHAYLHITVDRHYWLWHRLDRLYRFRRQLGRFLFAYQMSSMESVAGAQDAYREIMMDACQVDYAPAYCWVDWDWSFASFAMLRGWRLSYLMLDTIRLQIGDDWYRNPESGGWLRDHWSAAVGSRIEDLYQQFAYADWTPELFAEALGREASG
jgi:hypothetical protein